MAGSSNKKPELRTPGLSRRELFGFMGATLAGVTFGRRVTAQPRVRPRYLLQVVLFGGVDGIWTLSPRTRSEVSSNVSLAYGPGDIVEANGLRFGPHARSLARQASTLTVVHGVQARTASHPAGNQQIVRCRLNTVDAMPHVTAIIGRHRTTQAVASVTLSGEADLYGPGWFSLTTPNNQGPSNDAVTTLEAMAPDDLQRLSSVYRARAAELRRLGGLERERIADELLGIAALADALPNASKFAPAQWAEARNFGKQLERVLWLFENDLTATVMCSPPAFWDTHWDNDKRQSMMSPPTFAALARLFDELDKRHNKYGRLSDQVMVLVASEFGRFPQVNARLGKDHFPEMSMLLRGPGLPQGTSFGVTDANMAARRIDLRTGAQKEGGFEVTLDEVGATLLRLYGIDPLVHGYTGRTLEYLGA